MNRWRHHEEMETSFHVSKSVLGENIDEKNVILVLGGKREVVGKTIQLRPASFLRGCSKWSNTSRLTAKGRRRESWQILRQTGSQQSPRSDQEHTVDAFP